MNIINSDGTGLRTIASGVDTVLGYQASWFPDNQRVVYIQHGRRIAAIDTSGMKGEVIFDPGTPNITYPPVSPDGESIVFSFNNFVHSIDVDGSNLQRLSQENASVPSWSWDGESIIYLAPANNPQFRNQNAIWLIKRDGSNAHQIVP